MPTTITLQSKYTEKEHGNSKMNQFIYINWSIPTDSMTMKNAYWTKS